MNVNSKPKAPTPHNQSVHGWLTDAAGQLERASLPTARLDAEVLLAHVLCRSRTWLHAHGDEMISTRQLTIADACLELRQDHVPVAYIIGHKEFYGRRFKVTPATLIPRPESEDIMTALSELNPTARTLLDVGTGSGCLGISAKLAYPSLEVTLSDVSVQALDVARHNAHALSIKLTIIQSDLLQDVTDTFDIIVANLPYVDRAWEVAPDIAHEPSLALYAADAGLALIRSLIKQAPAHLTHAGHLILEADPCQHRAIIDYSAQHGYCLVKTIGYIVVLGRAA
jgi:release factor glutamine methyltransferase